MSTALCPPYAPFFGFAGVASSMIFSSALSISQGYIVKAIRLVWAQATAMGLKIAETILRYTSLAMGAAYGTAKSGIGITGMGTQRPELIMKALIPVVMAGIIAVYGLVVSVLIVGKLNPSEPYALHSGFIHLAAGLSCGLTGLAAGHAIGVIGDACARAYLQQSRVFVAMVLMLIFGEVIGLYGLIVALILNTKATNNVC